MYKQANDNGLLIACDGPCRVLRVATNKPLLHGQRPLLRELASYSTRKEWEKSGYGAQITYNTVLDQIIWFWHDIETDTTTPA